MTDELDPQLQESIATTKQWKKIKLKQEHDAGFITNEEAFQFFVGALDAEGEKPVEEEEEEVLVSADVGITNQGPAVLIDIEESDLIYNVKPAYVSSKERMLIEEDIFYHPSTISGIYIPLYSNWLL
jgi:hypothetical protein